MPALMCVRSVERERRVVERGRGRNNSPISESETSRFGLCILSSALFEAGVQLAPLLIAASLQVLHLRRNGSAQMCYSALGERASVREREGEREKVHARESARAMWTKAIGWKLTTSLV